ncbi:hypothetical protein FCH28_29815 [Streptomyces piniterrae]|uniref:Peptidase M48 domain-containing protein n=1 Tax=Streptomyces piniterrae TaxID=2571125 RepID=A0A4U0MU69_9ACTN|nr:M48 family metalloprotease [Streptomyces piniterrae]TJZ44537.1 hypothetical protein FCH28_29815 [Streptomyces piniterrae]
MRPVDTVSGVTGTGPRFALLIAVVTASSIPLLDLLVSNPQDAWRGAFGCLLAAGFDPEGSDRANLLANAGRPKAMQNCLAGVTDVPYSKGMIATLVLLAVAGLVYWWLPKVRDRWRRTLPIEEVDADGALREELAALRDRTGIRSDLRFRVDPKRMTSGAGVYGRTGVYTVCLHAGLLARRGTDPEGFRAVVLHELAHVHNRDVDYAYASTALWRVFVLFALLPNFVMTGRVLAIALFGDVDSPFWPGAATVLVYPVLSGLLLVGLVHLARADLLRRRELHADLQAVAWGAHPASWQRPDPSGAVAPLLHRLTALLRTHPGWAERSRVLADSTGLFRASPLEMLLTGASAWLLFHALGTIPGLSGDSDSVWLTTLFVAPVLCIALGLSVVRTSRVAGGHVESGALAGLWLGCGMLVGEFVDGGRYRVDWLLPRPEYLLAFLLIAAVPAVWWSQTVRLALRFPKRGQRRAAALVCASVTATVLWGGVLWWQLGGQILAWDGGDLDVALTEFSFDGSPGPWRDYGLSAGSTLLPLLAPLHRKGLLAAATLLMWLVPLLLLFLRRAADGGFRIRRTLCAGLAGGLMSWAGLAVAVYALNTLRPPTLKGRPAVLQVLQVQVWWLVVAVLAACLVTAALVAALSRRHWLLRALIAAQLVQLLAYVGVFWLTSADGCLGPLNIIGGDCDWRPEQGLTIVRVVTGLTLVNAVLGSACAALVGAGAAWAVRRSRGLPAAKAPETPVPTAPARRRPGLWKTGTVLALGLPALLLTALTFNEDFASHVAPAGRLRDMAGAIDPPPVARGPKTRQWQASSWLDKGGTLHGQRITDAVQALNTQIVKAAGQKRNKDGQVSLDEKTFGRVCGTLGKRVDAAQDYFPAPGRDLGRTWSGALSRLGRGARGCRQSMEPGKGEPHRTNAEREQLFSMSLDDIVQGMSALSGAFEDVKRMATASTG